MRAIKNIIGSVFISIAALIFWVFILPGYEMQSYLNSSIETRSSALSLKSELIQKVADLNKEYQDKFSELKRLSLVIPPKKNVAEVLTAIEDIAAQSGIHLSDFSVFEGSNVNSTKPYNILSLNLGFEGQYEALVSFLNQLERHIRLIDAMSLGVSIKEDESTESQIILSASLKADLYFLKSTTEQKTITKDRVNIEGGN
ncbi:MAG: type 4a pilus biogenesis protein PilO [Candidatus Yanofskybacteria bacterium]|nr:type 4a pilus biogenesis protein PilO [Candidatus Yanofskybacteria bacterium]